MSINTSSATKKPITKHYIATVWWVSPRYGCYAETMRKMLSTGHLSEDTSFTAFNNDSGVERFLFNSEHDALAFKGKVEDAYRKEPLYFVIDDEGSVVEEDGKPLVAWEPAISIEAATREDLLRCFPIALGTTA